MLDGRPQRTSNALVLLQNMYYILLSMRMRTFAQDVDILRSNALVLSYTLIV